MTDRQLRNLFEQEKRIERQLAHVRARIAAGRRAYAERNGLLAFPSVDAMKKALGS
jgi:hypothetical protein